MKRAISVLLAAVMITTLLATGVAAGTTVGTGESSVVYTQDSVESTDYKGTVTYAPDTKAYTASYAGSDLVPDNQYVFMVIKVNAAGTTGYTVSEETIKYIDQGAGTGIDYTFIPSSVPECVVMLFGAFSEGATSRVLGKLTAQGIRVTGSVSYVGTRTKPVVTLSDGTNDYTATVDDPVGGTASYSIDAVPEGTYTLTISKKGHLVYTHSVTVNQSDAIIPPVSLIPGTTVVTDPDRIEFVDLSQLLLDYLDEEKADSASNLNELNYVDFSDLSILLLNYGNSY